jgi:hypothetical protein
MSFRMEVKVERVLEEGTYVATLANVEKKETKFGERLMWTFDIPEENTEVVGFTSTSYSTKANAYSWAKAIMGEIDPKTGWGPEDVIGGECVVVLEVAEDAQGFEKNKVVKVKPPKKTKAQTNGDEGPDEPNPNLESISL